MNPRTYLLNALVLLFLCLATPFACQYIYYYHCPDWLVHTTTHPNHGEPSNTSFNIFFLLICLVFMIFFGSSGFWSLQKWAELADKEEKEAEEYMRQYRERLKNKQCPQCGRDQFSDIPTGYVECYKEKSITDPKTLIVKTTYKFP